MPDIAVECNVCAHSYRNACYVTKKGMVRRFLDTFCLRCSDSAALKLESEMLTRMLDKNTKASVLMLNLY